MSIAMGWYRERLSEFLLLTFLLFTINLGHEPLVLLVHIDSRLLSV